MHPPLCRHDRFNHIPWFRAIRMARIKYGLPSLPWDTNAHSVSCVRLLRHGIISDVSGDDVIVFCRLVSLSFWRHLNTFNLISLQIAARTIVTGFIYALRRPLLGKELRNSLINDFKSRTLKYALVYSSVYQKNLIWNHGRTAVSRPANQPSMLGVRLARGPGTETEQKIPMLGKFLKLFVAHKFVWLAWFKVDLCATRYNVTHELTPSRIFLCISELHFELLGARLGSGARTETAQPFCLTCSACSQAWQSLPQTAVDLKSCLSYHHLTNESYLVYLTYSQQLPLRAPGATGDRKSIDNL